MGCKPASQTRGPSSGNFPGQTPQGTEDAAPEVDPGIAEPEDETPEAEEPAPSDPDKITNEIKTDAVHLIFSSTGPIDKMVCLQLAEARDPNSWDDNYLCGAKDYGLSWHADGAEGSDRTCTQIYNLNDPYSWIDNYLCAADDALQIRYVQGDVPKDHVCLQVTEPEDPDGWDKSFLCVAKKGHQSTLALSLPIIENPNWHSAQPATSGHCLLLEEPEEPTAHTWEDNYLCMKQDYGLTWHTEGSESGRTCTQIVEPKDPHSWANNYICAEDDRYCVRWSADGPIDGMNCVLIKEVAEPAEHSWTNNYFCVRKHQGFCSLLGQQRP